MPSGIFERTLKTRKKMSKSAKKRFENKENHPLYGKHHTEGTKEKIRIAHLGKHRTQEVIERLKFTYSGKNNGMYGKHHTKEALEKVGKTFFKKGKNHPSWKGGISKKPYPFDFNKELKELIRQRDNYRCQLCGMPECENIKKLCVHHIDYVKDNLKPDNLIALCISCNTIVNNNREKWIKYFQKGRRML